MATKKEHLHPEAVKASLCLLLTGKTGTGKSTVGNLIFNKRVFESRLSSVSVTRVCQKHTSEVIGREVTCVDTPDFLLSTHSDLDSNAELKSALELCAPGAHVILLCLPFSTFTEQEMDFLVCFEKMFGPVVLQFTLVLFTSSNTPHMRSLAELIRPNPQLSEFMRRVGQRCLEFKLKDAANRRQVNELMERIERLVTENQNSCYTLIMLPETPRGEKGVLSFKNVKTMIRAIKPYKHRIWFSLLLLSLIYYKNGIFKIISFLNNETNQ